ncbi:hypothetical protein HID58_031421 [Brassica napus]|uniref:Uncharacterized protein n=3 Tax=Brassica TaxID=3705 RepID=A0ABQ8BTD2_BRANA|nr:hypothetical protein HID58_031421 [Brassica napus]
MHLSNPMTSIEDVDSYCKSPISKGLVFLSALHAKIFLSYALDYLPHNLNKTMPEFARVASDGVVLFAGLLVNQKSKVAEFSKFGRPAKMCSTSWWDRFYNQISLEERRTKQEV